MDRFRITDVIEIGRKSLGVFGIDTLGTGRMFAFLSCLGTTDEFNDIFIKTCKHMCPNLEDHAGM